MTGGDGGNAGRNTAERLCRGNLVRAAVDRAADPERMRLDQVVKAESDAAVPATRATRRKLGTARTKPERATEALVNT